MSTHCGISVKTEKGYETIYCHHDGYPKYMYPMLMNNYNSEELASKLIGFGDACNHGCIVRTPINQPSHNT